MSIKNIFKKKLGVEKEVFFDEKDSFVISDVIKDKLDDVLNVATDNFFPKTGRWNRFCFKRDRDIIMANLPCHLRDSEWLTRMFIMNQKILMFNKKYVLNYVKNSKYFNEARHNYELEIVKWQINYMLLGGECWICDDEYGGDFISMSSLCDLGFRKGVVDTLTKIGMDKEVVEEGIEKNVAMWRDRYMEKAFSNEFDSTFLTAEYHPFARKEKNNDIYEPRLEPVDSEFRDAWMKMRLYEYYQSHKEVVDKYGEVLPEMQMCSFEVEVLQKILEEKTAERRKEIQSYKESKQKVKMHYRGNKAF